MSSVTPAPMSSIDAVIASLSTLEEQIYGLWKTLKELYAARFPELSTIAMTPLQFSQIILQIGEARDLTFVDLTGILGPNETLALQMIAKTTRGVFVEKNLQECLVTARELYSVCISREKMIVYIKERMLILAPNVSAIIGEHIAAKLIAATGGIVELSRCPANNIQVIGRDPLKPHVYVGYISECDDILASVPVDLPEYKRNAIRMIASKVSIASRIDALGNQHSDGAFGKKLKLEILARLDKLTESAPYKLAKPLPPPPIHAKKKRGGKRSRKLKEMTMMTAVRKQQNRIAFNGAEDELIVGDSVSGSGMLKGGERITMVDTKLRERVKKQSEKALTGIYASKDTNKITPFSFNAENALLLKKQQLNNE